MIVDEGHSKTIYYYYTILEKGEGIPINKELSLQLFKKGI